MAQTDAEITLTIELDLEEARALQILIDNYVRGGYNPIASSLFDVLESLSDYLPEVERYYGEWSDRGDNDQGISFAYEPDMWN